MSSRTFVPPGGAASMAQQTPAAKASMGMLRSVRTASRRKGSKAAKRYARNRKVLRRGGKKSGAYADMTRSTVRKKDRGWMQKGSPAAKRYMAKLRRMRKKK